MITVSVQRYNRKNTWKLIVKGHSYLGETGNDILCSAVSVLCENLGHSLEALLKMRVEIEKTKGLYKLSINKEKATNESELLFASCILGLRSLFHQYPKHIQIEEKK